MGLLRSNVQGTQHLSSDGVAGMSGQLPSRNPSLVNQVGPLPSNVWGDKHLLIKSDDEMEGSGPSRHRNRGRRRQRQVIDTSDEDGDDVAETPVNEVEASPYSDLDDLSEADFQYLESHAMMQAPSTESVVGVSSLNKDNPRDVGFLAWLGPEGMEQAFEDYKIPALESAALREAARQYAGEHAMLSEQYCGNGGETSEFSDCVFDDLPESIIQRLLGVQCAEAIVSEESAVPEMDTDGLDILGEEIDLDAQILDDRIDVYVSDVEDDGMELLIDEEFLYQDDVVSATKENESEDSMEGLGSEWHLDATEQRFYDKAYVACRQIREDALAEDEWDSNRSPFALNSWSWFRKALPGRLVEEVFKCVSPEARRLLSAAVLDVKSLLSLPEPKQHDLGDSCNSAGVYIFVCHGRREVDPLSGTNEAIDDDSVGCYTGQSIKKPMDNGRQGMSLRFDQHRREMGRTIPELEEKARKVSMNIPRFYRTVVEGDLVAHPRVVATIPRDSHMAARAMLIETVIMLITGSVSEESSYGLPTQALVANIQRQLSYEGPLKYQPKALNRALPVRQGFRAGVRIYRQCQQCEHNSSNYAMSFHTSQYTQRCLCRSCMRKEITERCRPELEAMGRKAIIPMPKERIVCESLTCGKMGERQRAFGWSAVYEDMVVCQSCRFKQINAYQSEILRVMRGELTDEEKSNLVCAGATCRDPTQERKKKVVWLLSTIERVNGRRVWLCAVCRNREQRSPAGKAAQATLEQRRDQGIYVPGMKPKKITAEMRYCQYEDCNLKKTNGGVAPQLAAGQVYWSIHPTRANWVVCPNCKLRERERLCEEELKRRGELVNRRGHTINETDKVCTEDGCEDPCQNAIQARMHAGEQTLSGHIWFRHPLPKEEGRVVCKSCMMSIQHKMKTEANRRARAQEGNPVRERNAR